MPDRMPDHPVERATDHSWLARAADRWRLYSPIVTPLFFIAFSAFVWVQNQSLLPAKMAEMRAEIDALQRADDSARSRADVIEAKLSASLIQQGAILRAVCIQLSARERELVGCPGLYAGGVGWSPPSPAPERPPITIPPRAVALRAGDDRTAIASRRAIRTDGPQPAAP